MLTRITDQKIPCVYIRVYQITKIWGPGPYNSLRQADNRRYFLGLSLTQNWREAHVLRGEGSGKIWTCSCSEKGNFIMINKSKYGQTWKIWLYTHKYHFTVPLRMKYIVFSYLSTSTLTLRPPPYRPINNLSVHLSRFWTATTQIKIM